jgi:hypothetical protein
MQTLPITYFTRNYVGFLLQPNRLKMEGRLVVTGNASLQSGSTWKESQLENLDSILTPWSRVLLEKLTSLWSRVKKFPAFLWNPKVLYRTHKCPPLSLYWANSIQSPPPHPTSWRYILILSSYLRLGLPNDLFPSGFPINILCTPLSSSIRATCPAHLILLDFTTRTILGKKYC